MTARRTLSIISCLLCTLLFIPAGDASEAKHDRESTKLQAKGVESLSTQALIDIYTACLGGITDTEGTRAAPQFLSVGKLQQHCKDQRKHLLHRTSRDMVTQLDELYLEARAKQQAGPATH